MARHHPGHKPSQSAALHKVPHSWHIFCLEKAHRFRVGRALHVRPPAIAELQNLLQAPNDLTLREAIDLRSISHVDAKFVSPAHSTQELAAIPLDMEVDGSH